tara:strand:+ start:15623 stop:16264 length:642 start_codon:yes stop_codon:yes gene_type:complete
MNEISQNGEMREHTSLRRRAGAFANPKHNVHQMGFREGMYIADLGAGSGAYTEALAALVGPSGAVYAVDVQRDLLTKIHRNLKSKGYENVHVVWGDMESVDGVDIRDGLLDAVVIANTLFQVDDKIRVLKEAWRVLKPAGILALVDWTDSFGGLGPPQKMVFTQKAATVLCTDHGFAPTRDFDAGEHHYGVLFTKQTQTVNDFAEKTVAQEVV